jgi:hypothetical protein
MFFPCGPGQVRLGHRCTCPKRVTAAREAPIWAATEQPPPGAPTPGSTRRLARRPGRVMGRCCTSGTKLDCAAIWPVPIRSSRPKPKTTRFVPESPPKECSGFVHRSEDHHSRAGPLQPPLCRCAPGGTSGHRVRPPWHGLAVCRRAGAQREGAGVLRPTSSTTWPRTKLRWCVVGRSNARAYTSISPRLFPLVESRGNLGGTTTGDCIRRGVFQSAGDLETQNPDLDLSVQPQRPTLSQDLREPQEILWVTFFRDATRLITLTKPVWSMIECNKAMPDWRKQVHCPAVRLDTAGTILCRFIK